MKAFLWTLFALTVIGIVYYGFAKTVLLTVLIGGGLFVAGAMLVGVLEVVRKHSSASAKIRMDVIVKSDRSSVSVNALQLLGPRDLGE